MRTKRQLTAPCGLDCFNCIVFVKNITAQMRTRVAQALNIPEDRVDCRGCRTQNGRVLKNNSCETFECVKAKGVEFCFECADFPCSLLQPAADCADRYPHNMKVFNLSRMKLIGVERWAEEESADVRMRYFKGRFVPGKGPVI